MKNGAKNVKLDRGEIVFLPKTNKSEKSKMTDNMKLYVNPSGEVTIYLDGKKQTVKSFDSIRKCGTLKQAQEHSKFVTKQCEELRSNGIAMRGTKNIGTRYIPTFILK